MSAPVLHVPRVLPAISPVSTIASDIATELNEKYKKMCDFSAKAYHLFYRTTDKKGPQLRESIDCVWFRPSFQREKGQIKCEFGRIRNASTLRVIDLKANSVVPTESDYLANLILLGSVDDKHCESVMLDRGRIYAVHYEVPQADGTNAHSVSLFDTFINKTAPRAHQLYRHFDHLIINPGISNGPPEMQMRAKRKLALI